MRKAIDLLESPRVVGLISNVLVVWGALALSIAILLWTGSSFGRGTAGPRSAPWTPAGEFIGAVWSLLYTLMALSLWRLNQLPRETRNHLKLAVIALIAFCLVWPFYAFDTATRWPGLLGNFGILVLALFATWRLWPYCRTAALMIAPVAAWITIASATILDGARRFGW